MVTTGTGGEGERCGKDITRGGRGQMNEKGGKETVERLVLWWP